MALKVATREKSNLEIAWDRVRGLKPLILKHRHEGDVMRRLPDAIAQAFIESDMYRFQVPEDMGGLELDPLAFFDLCSELSSYDASVGWNFGIGGGSISMLGNLPLEKLKRVFGTPDCGIAGSTFPPGRAIPVEGGYRFTGRWQWASGVHNAKWVNGTAVVYDGDQPRMKDGQPMIAKAQFATEDVTIHDAWHTGGMKGTGSTEYSLENHFVPEADIFEPFGTPSHPAPIFRLSATYFGLPLVAVITGIAKGTAEAFKELLLQNKSGLKDQGYAQYALAKAEALYESAQLYVKDAFRPIWDDALADRPTAMEDRVKTRRAYIQATDSAIEAVTLCYHAAGGAAVFDHNPFHRNLSDVHAASMHQLLTRKMMEQCGQAALGMTVDRPYTASVKF
jgi:alkylation response protein AidB-like acyl-CoA dehydrogenase